MTECRYNQCKFFCGMPNKATVFCNYSWSGDEYTINHRPKEWHNHVCPLGLDWEEDKHGVYADLIKKFLKECEKNV